MAKKPEEKSFIDALMESIDGMMTASAPSTNSADLLNEPAKIKATRTTNKDPKNQGQIRGTEQFGPPMAAKGSKGTLLDGFLIGLMDTLSSSADAIAATQTEPPKIKYDSSMLDTNKSITGFLAGLPSIGPTRIR